MPAKIQADETPARVHRPFVRFLRPKTMPPGKAAGDGSRLPRWLTLSSAVAMLCVASLFAGLILGWVARGALVADTEPDPASAAAEKDAEAATAVQTLPMPDVRGLSEADARQVLADAGYDSSIVKISNVPSVVAAGTVAAQTPVAGTANPSSVTLSLPSPANMPELTGKTVDEATRALAAMGAQPALKRVYEAKANPGTILGTDPASGAALTATPTLTVAGTAGSAPLSSLKESGVCRSVSSGTVNGTLVTDGVHCSAGQKAATTYWVLGRTLSRLKGTAGVDDAADPASRVKVLIMADGKSLLDQEFSYGQSANVDADISGVLRLEITVSAVGATGSLGQSILFANAVVLGSAEAIAALSPTP